MSQPQQDWSDEHQRWLQTVWNPHYQRWYRNHYIQGRGWVFFDWLPAGPPAEPPHPVLPATYTRVDSAHDPVSQNAFRFMSGATSAHTSRVGPMLVGKYDASTPGSLHYERLDTSFYVRSKDFFTLGKVFAVLFTEPAGSTITSYNDAISFVRYGESVHSQVRRFIVVRQKKGHCFAVPIFTYGNQGTRKPGVAPDEHAIAYSWGQSPSLLPGEIELEKDPICVIMNEGEQPLSPAARIFFGIHHPIQYNVKVKDLGYVHPEHMVNLLGYWAIENQEATNQAIEVTAQGAYEGGDFDGADQVQFAAHRTISQPAEVTPDGAVEEEDPKSADKVQSEGHSTTNQAVQVAPESPMEIEGSEGADKGQSGGHRMTNQTVQVTAEGSVDKEDSESADEAKLEGHDGTNLDKKTTMFSRLLGFDSVSNPRAFFKKGRVFITTWTDAPVHPEFAWFAVVKPKPDHCICLRINADDGATAQPSAAAIRDSAAVIPVEDVLIGHDAGNEPSERSIFVKVENDSVNFERGWRISFAKPYTVKYDIKVRKVGRVFGNSIGLMEQSFAEAMGLTK